ncbi:MAG TPA: CocE/NonD family hydrolase [Gemmatimonadaceae bacterium]|nr:CocE/NonD family hydrolase [Gemmatimonadaceae bacterium]
MRILILVAVLAATNAVAQQPDNTQRYVKTNAMIAMRDGVRLNTDIYAPRDQSGPLPMIFLRTPYGIDNRAGSLNASFKELADDGYIFVFQDIRGRYRSEGQFVMQRPARSAAQRKDAKAIDEATDAYDTIDWVVKNVPNNNGRVGMLGVSYDGWTTAMALTDPHPALRAASPQASPADMWLGDDFHHNGAFRLSYGFEYAAMMETSKENEQFRFPTYDTYEWYLTLGSLANVNKSVLKGKIPTWNDFVAHPDDDEFWQRQTLIPALTQVTVPTLNVAGWWDQEDFYGPVTIYERLEQFDRDHKNFLVVGPWNHGGWNAREGRTLGNIDFGSPTSKYFRDSIQAPFFAYYLKDRGGLRQPEAIVFEGGANAWRHYDAWPPKQNVSPRQLYFQPNGALSFDPPPASRCDTARPACVDAYVSDPAHPVPYRNRPIQATYDPRGSGWYTWLTEDQRFVESRPDVLSWRTQPLTEDVTIAGDVIADLFAATSGSDADWIVKLIDVYPEDVKDNPKMGGYEFMVSNEVFRGRYRRSFEHPSPLTPNRPAEFKYSLHGQSYRFQKGHRIMVQVQSTWFPIIDRNPQTFVPNIFLAKESDFRAATITVYRTPAMASHVTLPIVGTTVP